MSTEEQQNETNQPSNNDEEMRKLLCPSPCKKIIITTLEENYCENNEHIQILKELDSYDDRNYLISLNDKKYLCKVYNGVASLAFQKGENKLSAIILYNALFDHLSQTKDINASYAMHTKKEPSNFFCTMVTNVASTSHSPQELVVQLLHWVEGEPMSCNKSLTIDDFKDAGLYLGKLNTQFDQFMSQQEDSFKNYWKTSFLAWDMKQVVHLRNFIQYIDTEERRQFVTSVIEEFEEKILQSGVCDQFRISLCHGDFNDANIIMRHGKVSGVIDFGDCCYSWRVADVAIAMAYSLLTTYSCSTRRSLSAAASFLRAFHSVYPLTKLEIQYLRILVQSRLAQSVTYGAFTRAQNPDNEYILLHSKPAWNALEMLCSGGSKRKEKIDIFFVTASCSSETQNLSDIDLSDSDIIG